MIDIYALMAQGTPFPSLRDNELLAGEYMSREDDRLKKVWSEYNSLAYVLEGEKTWVTEKETYKATQGSILFCQKGGQMAFNCLEGTTRVVLLFFPDSFVKDVFMEFSVPREVHSNGVDASLFKVFPLAKDRILQGLMQSVHAYFFDNKLQSRELLRLKCKELLLQILTRNEHAELKNYLFRVSDQKTLQLTEVMENNYLYPMRLEEFAQLAHCSLSTFKREFQRIYKTTPGKWLLQRRLAYAKHRLLQSKETVNEIAYIAGFENASHFIQSFKKEYGCTPSMHRKISNSVDTSPTKVLKNRS